MKCYLVGGAVRDRLLGRSLPAGSGDRDWVVVGSTPEEMVSLGYTPVGRDFPVFLHPVSHEEYALARTERKSGRGYQGFVVMASPEVTLEEDLARRDLTINAIAQDPISGELIDPFGGQRDLAARLLRHVGPAFVEDPVRLLRIARLAARFADFSVAPQTRVLLSQMVDAGEVDALVPERVWQELSRGLMETRPDRVFEVLRSCGALARLLPEVDRLWGVPPPGERSPPPGGGLGGTGHPESSTGQHLMRVLQMAARLQAPLAVRYACLCHDLGEDTTPAADLPRRIGREAGRATLARAVSERWRVPTDCRELADCVAREHDTIHRSADLDAAALMGLLERCDALRRPQRFEATLLACECDARGRLGQAQALYPQRARLSAALAAALAAPVQGLAEAAAAAGLSGPAIGERIRQARVLAIQAAAAAALQA